jgi:hypothetical protein
MVASVGNTSSLLAYQVQDQGCDYCDNTLSRANHHQELACCYVVFQEQKCSSQNGKAPSSAIRAILSAKQMEAKRIIAMSRHPSRQKLAREFGATEIVTERGGEGVARIKELTNGIGADSVLECVGTHQSMMQAINSTRSGGYVSYVGVPHGVTLDGVQLFFSHVHLHGGPAPVRRFPQMDREPCPAASRLRNHSSLSNSPEVF